MNKLTANQVNYKTLRNHIIHTRFIARKAIRLCHEALDQKRSLERHKRKLTEQGITFIMLDQKIKTLNKHADNYYKVIIDCGEMFFLLLDKWQEVGATLKDLCNLCNKPYRQALKEIRPDRIDDKFSGIMFVHHLDFLHDEKSEFIPYDADMPITFCIQEFLFHQIDNNQEVKEKNT